MKTKALRGETVAARLEELVSRLQNRTDTPGLDAQVLLAHVLNEPRALVLAHPETPLTRRQAASLDELAARLEQGEPLPYVLGTWEFFGLEFTVTPDVLIPRPETELLVEKALDWLHHHPDCRQAADIGTGSGCIAVALAVNVPDLHILATDISCPAVEVARKNAKKHAVARRVECFCSDLLPADGRTFNLVVANLPYIPTHTLQGLDIFGREPTLALDGGADGLDLIRRFLIQVPERIVPGSLVLMEIEASQGPQVLSLVYDVFSEAEIHLHKDTAGRDRLMEIQV
jgi:release factor glutamine methyltransferase